MDEFTIRVLFLLAGVVLGWGLGLLHSMNRYAKRTRDNTEYCRAVLQRRLDTEGSVPVPPHATETSPASVPDYSSQAPLGKTPPRDERGAVSFMTVGMVIALAVVLFSLVSTLQTNKQVAENSDALLAAGEQRDRENTCTSTVLFGIVDAINERTDKTAQQNEAQVALQQAQLRFLTTIREQGDDGTALEEYIKAGTEYVKAYSDSRETALANPYPTQEEYAQCLKEARE